MTDSTTSKTQQVWVIRTGWDGEHYESNLQEGVAGHDWQYPLDLSEVASKQDLKDILHKDIDDPTAHRVGQYASQIWTLLTDVRVGDLVLQPRKATSKAEREFSLGIVTRGYWYRNPAMDGLRHVISVDWKRTNLPLTALQPDLQKTLNRPPTIYRVSMWRALARLQQVVKTGMDPELH